MNSKGFLTTIMVLIKSGALAAIDCKMYINPDNNRNIENQTVGKEKCQMLKGKKVYEKRNRFYGIIRNS